MANIVDKMQYKKLLTGPEVGTTSRKRLTAFFDDTSIGLYNIIIRMILLLLLLFILLYFIILIYLPIFIITLHIPFSPPYPIFTKFIDGPFDITHDLFFGYFPGGR